MKQPEQSYTAIETADGFLFFTHTVEGQANMQKFLQLVADHYFDPHFNLGPIHVRYPPTRAVCQSGREPVH